MFYREKVGGAVLTVINLSREVLPDVTISTRRGYYYSESIALVGYFQVQGLDDVYFVLSLHRLSKKVFM